MTCIAVLRNGCHGKWCLPNAALLQWAQALMQPAQPPTTSSPGGEQAAGCTHTELTSGKAWFYCWGGLPAGPSRRLPLQGRPALCPSVRHVLILHRQARHAQARSLGLRWHPLLLARVDWPRVPACTASPRRRRPLCLPACPSRGGPGSSSLVLGGSVAGRDSCLLLMVLLLLLLLSCLGTLAGVLRHHIALRPSGRSLHHRKTGCLGACQAMQ